MHRHLSTTRRDAALAFASLFALSLVAGCTDDVGAGDTDTGSEVSPDVPDTSPPDTTEGDTSPDGDTSVPEDTAGPVDTDPGDTAAEALTLTQVLPGKGLTIGLEQVELVGTGFFQGIQVTFGESLAQDVFVLNSKRLIVLTPPRGPGLVDVRVADPDSGASALLEAGFLYYSPIAITSIEPETTHILGGERITVRGNGFVPGSVLLIGRRSAIQTQVLDNNTITALAPAGEKSGPVDVRVSNAQGVGLLDDGLVYVDVPRIDTVIPPVGPVAGGTPVEVRGQSFYEPFTVLIGGKPLENPKLVSETRITGTVPAGTAQGPVDVILSTPYGTGARARGFTYVTDLSPGNALEVLSLSPVTGVVTGGESFTIVAKGLTAGATVTFGGAAATSVNVNPNGLVITGQTPAGAAPGAVNVTVTLPNGQTQTLTSAFTYLSRIEIGQVTPARGPVAGGTAIEITGEGFLPGLELRIGALSAASVQVMGSQIIKAVTPPGAPGLSDVVVIQSGRVTKKPDAFTYDAPYALWAVDPPLGAQAGGTQVSLIGAGFPADAKVSFGSRQATHVQVVSPTLILCKSPPGDLGTVSVSLASTTAGQTSLADSFTYYDPTSAYGGTWGGSIDNDVNVTVLSSGGGAPIPDAFVMLWTDPRTPYQGFTNERGQITFSGVDLAGEQMVSASKPGFSRASVVEYNATNVTLYLNPTTPPSPGNPPTIEPAVIRGIVTNLDKALPIPFGKCSNKFGAPSPLCRTCTSDTDCGAGHCSELPDQFPGGESGRFCTTDCTSNAQCPSDFMCVPLVAGQAQQCAPKAGVITAFCDITNESIFSDDVVADPGIRVDSEARFEMDPGRFGEVAVYCTGGVYDATFGEFTPLVMGVERHLLVLPGDEIEVEIELDHPLGRTQYVTLDPVPRGPEGPNFNYIFPYVDLGSDGVIFLPTQAGFVDGEPFILEHFLSGLTGDLYDASFTFLGGSFSFTDTNLPYTLTLHQNLTRLDDDTMYYLDATGTWKAQRTGVTKNVNGLFWGGENLVGVGSKGLIVRSVGDAWASQESGVREDLRAVHGAGSEIVAVGDLGNMTRWDGFRWQPIASPTVSDLRSVWLASPTEGWAVGAYATLHLQNGTWTAFPGAAAVRNLFGVWGFAANDVWAVGASGTILRWDGIAWNSIASGTNLGLRAVWGAAPDDVWFVGEGGIVLRWNGVEVKKVSIDTTQTLTAIWGKSASDITVVGRRSTAFKWNGAVWAKIPLGASATNIDFFAIGGPATGTGTTVMTGSHELVLGPILAVPEKMSPGNGALMGNDYRISWQAQPGTDPHFSYVEVAIPTLFGPVAEWTMINDYDVQSILLPDFPSIEGTPGIDPGTKYLTIYRIYKEGFDIDNYSNTDINQFGWRSWSVNQVIFSKL
ncbi:MAG: IPT/TIG domain-containing protein [Deltaproteobacteria bacterium]|nr:IPT/TIG domain-containing protein [Deltaproteobacteria bacterium]